MADRVTRGTVRLQALQCRTPFWPSWAYIGISCPAAAKIKSAELFFLHGTEWTYDVPVHLNAVRRQDFQNPDGLMSYGWELASGDENLIRDAMVRLVWEGEGDDIVQAAVENTHACESYPGPLKNSHGQTTSHLEVGLVVPNNKQANARVYMTDGSGKWLEATQQNPPNPHGYINSPFPFISELILTQLPSTIIAGVSESRVSVKNIHQSEHRGLRVRAKVS